MSRFSSLKLHYILLIWTAHTLLISDTISNSTNHTHSNCVHELAQWIEHHGGFVSPSIHIRDDDISARGVYATQSIPAHEKLLSIPVSLLFTVENARALISSILPSHKKNAFSHLGQVDILALALLIEHANPDSFWRSYMQCLPSAFALKYTLQHPLFWSDADVDQYLQTSKIGAYLRRRLRSIRDAFAEIQGIIQGVSYLQQMLAHKFTMEQWLWSLIMVWSRAFSVSINHRTIKCLVPFGDFFNFNATLNENVLDATAWKLAQKNASQQQQRPQFMSFDVQSFTANKSDGEYFVFRLRDGYSMTAGSQLFAEYSTEVLPNFVVFLDYGFCIEDNPMDGVWITAEDLLSVVKQNYVRKYSKQKKPPQNLKPNAQSMMKSLIEHWRLTQIFVIRPLMLRNTAVRDMRVAIEPYTYSLFLLSLILNAHNDIAKFGADIMNFRTNHPRVTTNEDIVARMVQILRTRLKSEKKTIKLVRDAWNTLNLYFKHEMAAFPTSLIQDLMIDEQVRNSNTMPLKLNCGLNIRTNEKFIWLSAWNQLQKLRNILLALVEGSEIKT